jgi:hypothetical protein
LSVSSVRPKEYVDHRENQRNPILFINCEGSAWLPAFKTGLSGFTGICHDALFWGWLFQPPVALELDFIDKMSY